MSRTCKCSEWKELMKNTSTIIKFDSAYGWILNWIELTDEEGYTQVHRYGTAIKFCPMCGKLIESL